VSTALLIDAAIVGPLRRSPGRTALAVVAIALGVALGFAIYLINRTAADEMSLAARSLFGVADLAVEVSAGGMDEALYPRVARLEGIAVASPMVRIEAKLASRRGALTLLGVDAFRSRLLQPAWAAMAMSASSAAPPEVQGDEQSATTDQQLFLSATAAQMLQLQAGEVLDLQVGLQRSSWRIAGVLPSTALPEAVGLLDIATAQWKFGKLGQLTRIDLRLAAGASHQRMRAQLAALLPANARVVTPGTAQDDTLRLSSAYRSNLSALALVALFTGGFLVYSTQALTVLRRRREFALLHALGATRTQQIGWILSGGALVGVAGAVLGVLLGMGIAQLAIVNLGSEVGGGYLPGMAGQLQVGLLESLVFCALGSGVALVGSLQPALDAASIPTATALKAGDVASGTLGTHNALVLVLLAAAGGCLLLPPLGAVPLPGYAAIALLILASVLAMPSLLRGWLAWLPVPASVPVEIALSHLRGTARYVNLSISAILVSFSLMVAMLIMVSSFRNSLDLWTQKLLPADLYVRSGYIDQSAAIDAATLAGLARLPAVARVEGGRLTRASLPGQRSAVALIARPMDEASAEERLWLRSRATQPVPTGAIPVWVSEAAADLYALTPGQGLQLLLGPTQVSASIRGVWRDYEHQGGAVLLDRADYVRVSGDTVVNTVSFWLRPDASEQQAQQQIRQILPADVQYDMRTPGELRRLSLQAFDRTFAVTYLLELVAVIIGLLGISASTSAQVLARRGEFGLLRHLGLTRQQIAVTLACEGLVLGVGGVAAGLLNGAVIGAILIYVVNRQSFHWSMDLFPPYLSLLALSALLITAAAVIAVVSGRQAMSGDVVRAVKEDW
jgi:putative ABC transport system permease protein